MKNEFEFCTLFSQLGVNFIIWLTWFTINHQLISFPEQFFRVFWSLLKLLCCCLWCCGCCGRLGGCCGLGGGDGNPSRGRGCCRHKDWDSGVESSALISDELDSGSDREVRMAPGARGGIVGPELRVRVDWRLLEIPGRQRPEEKNVYKILKLIISEIF